MRLYGILFSLALTTTALAETEDSVRIGEQLEEVAVIGFKQDRAALSPVSQSTVGSLFVQNNELAGLRDLSGMMANFYMPDYGSRQYSPIYIRGIGSKINSPAVGIYVDGMPYFDRTVLDMDLFGISKVEVLRGPQGTLFGRNATAGLINIFTHSPLDYQNTMLKASFATYNDLQIGLSTYNRLSPSVGISLTANYHHNDGFFRNHYLGTKADRINNGTARLGLTWKPSPNWLARYSFSLDLTRQKGYPYGLYDEAAARLQPVFYNRESGYQRLVATAGMNWRYDRRRFSFNSQTAFQHSHDKIHVDQDYTQADLLFVNVPLRQNQWSQEFTFRSKNDTWYHWITGLFGFYQRENFTSYTDYIQKNFNAERSNRLSTAGIAVYHVSTFDLFTHFSASLGLRYDFEEAHINHHFYRTPLNNPSGRTELSNFQSRLHNTQLTPKFTLKYQPSLYRMLYATVSKGFKAGGFNASIKTEADRSYQPEYTWNYEIGTKIGLCDGRLTLEASLFYIDWKHQQLPITIPALGNIVRNVAHSSSKGLELSVNMNPVKGLFLQMNYGYTYAKMLRAEMEAQDYSGHMLPMVPRNTLSLNANYTLYPTGKWLDKLLFNANLTGVGKLYWREDNAMKQSFYSLLNLKVAATKGRFTWEVWTRNTTNTRYLAYYFVASHKMGQQGKPFMLGTSVIFNLK
jgi:outer membrane protein